MFARSIICEIIRVMRRVCGIRTSRLLFMSPMVTRTLGVLLTAMCAVAPVWGQDSTVTSPPQGVSASLPQKAMPFTSGARLLHKRQTRMDSSIALTRDQAMAMAAIRNRAWSHLRQMLVGSRGTQRRYLTHAAVLRDSIDHLIVKTQTAMRALLTPVQRTWYEAHTPRVPRRTDAVQEPPAPVLPLFLLPSR